MQLSQYRIWVIREKYQWPRTPAFLQNCLHSKWETYFLKLKLYIS